MWQSTVASFLMISSKFSILVLACASLFAST